MKHCYLISKPLILMALLIVVTSAVFAQDIDVKGTVLDADDGMTIPGVTVLEKGTTNGTVTDLDGKYKLTVPQTATLVFSYVGYETQEFPAISGEINVNLKISSQMLEEVLVIGYGTQKKTDKTGAVSHVTAEELNAGRTTDPIKGIQGKAAGVIVSKKGGDPNAGYSVKIRGQSGLSAGTDPLYVVDGIPGVDPTTIAPEDIESFNVLKDASSTAIYGARGANGVILITTKNLGVAGKGKKVNNVDFNTYLSFDKVANQLNLLSADQMREYVNSNPDINFVDGGANTDWQDEIYRDGVTQSYNLAFSGADENSSYRASVTHADFSGIIKGSSKSRTVGLLNMTQKSFNDKLTLNAGLSGTIEHNEYVQYGGGMSPGNVLYQAFQRNPTDPVYNSSGGYYETKRDFNYYNPVAIINNIQNQRDAKRFRGNFTADYEIIHGLKAGVNLAYIRNDAESFYFEPTYLESNPEGFARRAYDNFESKLLETTLKYNRSFDMHNLHAVAGYSFQEDINTSFFAQGKEPHSNFIQSNDLGTLNLMDDMGSYKGKNNLISFFGRAVYNYNEKYYFTGTLRHDGSSKFGKNNKWGTFPSASIGWNMASESFMESLDFLDQLKLRASWGKSGNQEFPRYLSITTYTAQGQIINPETGLPVIDFTGNRNPNPDLKWEENKEWNFGVDFAVINSRISGTFEYYIKNTYDLLYLYQVPKPPNVFPTTWDNAGAIDNKGFEATIQAFVFDKKKFDWKTTFVFSTNKQEFVSFDTKGKYEITEQKEGWVSGRGLVGTYTQIIREGYELGTYYLPVYAGLSEDGKFLFHTAAGGVTRDVTKAERRIVGHAQPDFELGWSNYFTVIDNIDISFSFRTVYGFDVYNATAMFFSNPAVLPNLNATEEALNEAARGLNDNPKVSDYYLEDGSFVRLENITIGYTFNTSKRDWLKRVRLYFTANNLFTLTNYSGIDPEISYSGLSFGLDNYDIYPKTRAYTFGLNVSF
jgi:iron complex outermembrane receptor protein